MARAATTPPSYGFRYVCEYLGPLDPKIAKVFCAYAEPQRQTHNILLLGKQRPLVFLVASSARNRALRLHWKDRTQDFFREFRKNEETGEWVRIETPPPITAPDPRTQTPPADPNDPLGLTVKELRKVLSEGKLDDRLKELLDRERKGDNPMKEVRGGAVAALAARYGQVVTNAESSAGG